MYKIKMGDIIIPPGKDAVINEQNILTLAGRDLDIEQDGSTMILAPRVTEEKLEDGVKSANTYTDDALDNLMGKHDTSGVGDLFDPDKVITMKDIIDELNPDTDGSIVNKVYHEMARNEDFDKHKNDTRNPHQVTYDQTGAAPEVHTHNFTDIKNFPEVFNPEVHANAHAKDGNDPVTPDMIGAETPIGAYEKAAAALEKAKKYTDDAIAKIDNPDAVDLKVETALNQAKIYTEQKQSEVQSNLDDHVNDLNNPHQVTLDQIGAASNVDLMYHRTNTSNPHNVTTEQIGAANQSDFQDHIDDHNNPHQVTVDQIGAETPAGAQLKADIALDNAKEYIDQKITNIVDAAPEELDTLRELSEAIRDDDNAISVLTREIATKANQIDFNDHITNYFNPHNVTKEQVGLGSVPNVTTNDQTPTFTAATSLETLSSGEKLTESFAKISKAISDLISHIANKSNPHAVTAAQTGAYTKAETNSVIETKITNALSKSY